MNKNLETWQDFIQNQDTPLLTLQGLDTIDQWLCDLSHWDIILITGKDATSFLQGQISCDIHKVSLAQAQLAACINLKGRIVSNFIICMVDDFSYALLCPPNTSEITTKTLKKYAIFSKVSIDQDLTLALSAGSNINTEIQTEIQTLNLTAFNFQLYLAPNQKMQAVWENAQKQSYALNSQFFDYQVIQHAVAFIPAQYSEMFTPQEINFELVEGISFTKGCYTGQEVVARLHYRGTPKRRCYIAQLNNEASTQSELTISPSNEIKDVNNKTQGHVINATTIESITLSLISLSIQSYEAFNEDALENRLSVFENKSHFTQIKPAPYPMHKD